MKFFNALKKGFTLVELVIVIAVIAVLSAVLFPVFGNVIQESKISALKSNLKTCSSNLIMYAQSAGIDYYTVNDVKEYLESSGISTSKPTYDGYSIWYNQKNMNLSLIKNKDLSKKVKISSATAQIDTNGLQFSVNGVTAYSANNLSAFSSSGVSQLSSPKVDRLGRRPEALTSDIDLLFINGDKEANKVKPIIEAIYTLADPENRDEAQNTDSFITRTNNNLNSVSIMKQIDWDIASYVDCFNPDKTAWLSKDGNWYTNSADGKVDNIVVSSRLGEQIVVDGFEGILRSFKTGQQLVDGTDPIKLTTACAIEIATSSEIKLSENFFTNISEGVNNIYYVGRVNVDNSAHGGTFGGQNVVTAAGGIAGRINSAVSSGDYSIITSGGSGSQSQYVSVSLSSGKSKFVTPQQALNYLYSVTESEKYDKNGNVVDASATETYEKLYYRLSNGKIAYDLVKSSEKAEWYANSNVGSGENTQTAQFKFVVPTVSLNLKNFAEEYDIKEIRSFILKEIECFGYHTVSLFGTYEENPKDGQSEGVIKGITFNMGVGYINYFDDKTFQQQDANGENVYHKIQDSSNTDLTSAGSLLISLPSGADKLNDYADENLYITVKYKNATNYYIETVSTFGASIIGEPVFNKTDETSSVISVKANSVKKSDGTYLIDFGDVNAIDFSNVGSATHYANFAKIESITFSVKNGSQEKILLVKRY